MEIIESVFTTLDYEEEIWATIVYRYLDQQLQDWYDQTKPSFLGSNDWNKFKELLTQYPVVPSWLSSTMATVTSTSPSSNETNSTTNDNNHAIEDKKLPTSLQRQTEITTEDNSIVLRTVSPQLNQEQLNQLKRGFQKIPKFNGKDPSQWLDQLLFSIDQLFLG
ncbi:unnamed protein product, partial [Didymodactylos carnosus]